MKNIFCHAVLFLALSTFFFACSSRKSPKRSKYDNIANLMAREFRLARDPQLNIVPTERLLEAKILRDEILEIRETMKSPVPGISWEERGSNTVGGRTRVLWFDLNDAGNGYKKVWAAGVGGGLWFTNDITVANPTWNKVNDLLENMAIGAFVQSRTNPQVMYFGTGEGWFNSDAMQGAGIWKSVNGGTSWSRLTSTETFYYVQDLIIDDNENVFATVRVNNLGGGQRGVQRSTNGGSTWTQVLSSPTASSDRGGDLELASNGDIYVSMGTISSNGGIYRSSFSTHTSNTGATGTWTNITPNPSDVIGAPSNWWHRIELACAPSDENIVYALFQGFNSFDCEAIKQYDASTNTWINRTVPTIVDQGDNSKFTRLQGFYNLIATVDPNDAGSLWIGGIDALRSNDSAKTWTQMTTWSLFNAPGFAPAQNVHADHHAISFSPGSSSRAVWGTDGGVYFTSNANIAAGKPTFASKNRGYNVTQYYSVAPHPTSVNYFLAGAQDNGSHKFTTAGLNTTVEVTGGDGGFCFIDKDNPNIQITSYVNNNYHVSTNGGNSFSSFALNNRGDFINPTDYESSTNTLYSGDDGGFFFRWSNPQNAGGGTAVETQVSVPAFGGAAVSHVAVSPITAGRVFFGLENGSVVRVDDAGTGSNKTGVVIRSGTGNVSCVVVDPNNENHIVVTYSNYGVNSVFETYNALVPTPGWTSIEGNLPDMPVRWAMFDPRNPDWMLLATELGVWSTNDLDGTSTEWTVTNSGLANVRVDMLKYRESTRTIAAATHGRGLFTAIVPGSSTPDINFSTGILVAAEQSSQLEGCRGFVDYNVNMTIANPPTGNATVTVSATGGNSVNGVDYAITTNGNFASPSNAIVFASGATDAKTITVRVYDDAEVESPENFNITYSLSGGSNAQTGIGAQSIAVSMEDNDRAPVAFASTIHTIGSPSFPLGDINSGQPFDSKIVGKKTMIIYKASELTAMGVTAGNISSIAFNFEKSSTRPYQNLQIRMGATTIPYLVDGSVFLPTVALVASPGNYSSINGWNTFTLDQAFAWNGVDNIAVQICYTNSSADATQLVDRTMGYVDASSGASRNNMFWQDIACATNFSSVTRYTGADAKPAIRFGQTVAGTAVATALTTTSNFLNRTNDFYLYNNAGEIIARVRNLSGTHVYGCTDLEIDRAGTGVTQFWNAVPANRLMNKTFRIVPASNNPTGNYEITLYYTQAEVAGWESATGQSFNNIKLIKTAGRISSVTPSNPTGAGAVSVVDPIIGTLGTNRTLTYTFTTGFSGFGAGIPGASVLPVSLLDFHGKLNNSFVSLHWSTSMERNFEGFELERSYDGVSFTRIAFVKARGGTNSVTDYSYLDKTAPKGILYYRLKQLDIDQSFEFSKVISITNSFKDEGIRLLQNPVKERIEIRFTETGSGRAEILLTNLSGQILATWSNEVSNGTQLNLPLSGLNLAHGVYILKVKLGGKDYLHRVVKK